MGGYINPESKVMQLLYKITEMMLLSVLWTIASLPLITMGAASSALYYAVQKVIYSEEGIAWGEFWRGFRTNYKQATKLWIPILILLVGAIADVIIVYLLSMAGERNKWATVPFLLLLVFGLMWLQYVFPYVARFEDRIKTILFNTFWMSLFHFLHSLFLLVVFIVFVGMPFFFPILLPVAVFFFPGLYMVIAVRILESRFKIHMSKEELEGQDVVEE